MRGHSFITVVKCCIQCCFLPNLVPWSPSTFTSFTHVQYWSTIWHFYSARNSKKLKLLNKHALRRIILGDNKVSTYEVLLGSLDLVSLRKRLFLDMLILVYTSFQPTYQHYLHLEPTLGTLSKHDDDDGSENVPIKMNLRSLKT